MPAPTPFTLDLSVPGVIGCTVNAQPVDAAAVHVQGAVGEIPVLTLQVAGGGKLEGEAFVHVAGAVAGDAVRALDPAQMRQRCAEAERAQAMASDPYALALEVVATMLDETTP